MQDQLGVVVFEPVVSLDDVVFVFGRLWLLKSRSKEIWSKQSGFSLNSCSKYFIKMSHFSNVGHVSIPDFYKGSVGFTRLAEFSDNLLLKSHGNTSNK